MHSQMPSICLPQDRWGEAARKLAEVLNDDTFRSLEGKSKHQLWLELCDMVTKHPKEVSGMKVDAILRGGIRKFTDEVRLLQLVLCGCAVALGMEVHEGGRDPEGRHPQLHGRGACGYVG